MVKRVILVVLDSLGVGALNDAGNYSDEGADTLGHILDNYPLDIPNLRKVGMGNIEGAADGRLRVDAPQGAFGRFTESSLGKDTITGHWEIAGLETMVPFKTYPDGFPKELMDEFVTRTGRGYLGNESASGTEIIERLGDEHEKSGKVIVYTSSDSVFQVAANTDVVPLEELYRICETARELLVGEYSCGRVIARPYVIKDGKRVRTFDRKDYAVSPPDETMLDVIKNHEKKVYCIGKISDIFNGHGVCKSVHTDGNDDGISKTIQAIKEDFEGLVFTNLVDFDTMYGHRRNPQGYGKAIEDFDRRLPEILEAMGEEDILMMCSDHGNDPVHPGWDHTREHIFFLACGDMIKAGTDIGTGEGFACIGQTIVDMLTDGKATLKHGVSYKEQLI